MGSNRETNDKGEPANCNKAVCKIYIRKMTARDVNTSNVRAHLRTTHSLITARINSIVIIIIIVIYIAPFIQ